MSILSCNKQNDDNLELILIGQGNLYGNGVEKIDEGNQVIDQEKDWNDLLDRINSVNNESDTFTETKIDFKEYMVIACFDQIRASGGYGIEATDIEKSGKNVDITIKKTQPQGMVTTVITQPFYIAKIPKTKNNIRFK